jgi:hypothetical protein
MPARHPLQSSAEQRASPAIAGARTGGLNPGGLWTSRLQKKAGRDTKEDGHVASGIMGHCSVSLSHGHECVHGKGSKAERSIGPAKTSVCRSESRGIGLARYGQEVEMPFTHAACRATGRSRLGFQTSAWRPSPRPRATRVHTSHDSATFRIRASALQITR